MVSVDSCPGGSTVSLSDSSGNQLVSWQPDKAYSCVVISCPEIAQGSTYTLTTGDSSTQITMDSLIYGSGGMGGMGGGMHGGNMGGMGGGNRGGQP